MLAGLPTGMLNLLLTFGTDIFIEGALKETVLKVGAFITGAFTFGRVPVSDMLL